MLYKRGNAGRVAVLLTFFASVIAQDSFNAWAGLAAWMDENGPHVYYQDTNDRIQEIWWSGGRWEVGALQFHNVKAVQNTSIAVTTGIGTHLVYLTQPENSQTVSLTRISWMWTRWLEPQILVEGVSPTAGFAAYTDENGNTTIFFNYADSPAVGQCVLDALDPTKPCTFGQIAWNDAATGTSIAAFLDSDHSAHVYYQGTAPERPILERYYDRPTGQWVKSILRQASPANAQFAAGNWGMTDVTLPATSMFFATNDQLFNQLTYSFWNGDRDAPHWTDSVSIARVKSLDRSIAVTGYNGNMRAYFITPDGGAGMLTEISSVDWGIAWRTIVPPYYGTSWYTDFPDLVRRAWS